MNPQIYLCGGAVRDELRGIKCNDKDYVVVGATEEWMLQNGFKKVGASFPVFLDENGVEYALARTEKKIGKGYHGFAVNTANVSLVDDLLRRDLTVNSIAKNILTGEYIDPYGGIADIKNKILKHTSDAFAEDPLRVIRLARFNAQFGSEWSVDKNTILLCKSIVASGELQKISKERIWKEFEKVLKTPNCHLFFRF